jgi:deazaflavin-dependent oxidoreductase (nitroreductase family)
MESNALARLKRLAGKSTLILTHYGRKSGKPYEVKIWFVVDGAKVFIGTANVEHQWVENVQKNPRIKLSVGGEKFEAEARFLDDPAERDRALAAMGRKYWMYSPFCAWEDDSHRPHAQPDWGVRGDIGCIGLLKLGYSGTTADD